MSDRSTIALLDVLAGATAGAGMLANAPRVVATVIPPGEGDPQTELYRRLTGATSVKSLRVEYDDGQ